jgi:hypothetical protein
MVDLTPTEEVCIAGFGLLNGSEGVIDPITARALALRVQDLVTVIVAVDLIGLHHHQVEAIRALVAAPASGVRVLVAATHTHAGPDTLGMWGLPPISSGMDDDYVARVISGVAEAINAAVARLTPVTVHWGRAQAPAKGIVRNLRHVDRVDRTLTALAFDRVSDGAPVATIVHFAAHPEALGSGNSLLSADFPSILRDTVEAARPESVALFLNGAIGGLVTTDEDGPSVAEMERIGKTLGELALSALEAGKSLGDGPLELACSRRPVHMPVENWRYYVGDTFGIFGGRSFDDGYTSSEVMALRIGSAVLVTVPGEIEPHLGAAVLEGAVGDPVLLIGLGNDELGYLMSESEWESDAFSYERTVSPGPLAARLLRRTVPAALRDVGALPNTHDITHDR